MTGEALHAAAVTLLGGWRAPAGEQDRLRRRYLRHLDRHPDGLWKDGPPVHLTASCFVLDPAGSQVLLTLHRKGRFWVQLGGHCEPGDPDLPAVAAREAREESGIAGLTLLPGPLDLHAHRLGGGFGRCREHLDVAFVAVAPVGAPAQASAESEDLAWWPVTALPAGVVPDLPPRLRRALALVRSQSASATGRSRAAATPSR